MSKWSYREKIIGEFIMKTEWNSRLNHQYISRNFPCYLSIDQVLFYLDILVCLFC